MKKLNLIFVLIGTLSFLTAVVMPDPFGDYDSDGVLNMDDNCYYVYNPFQTDNDNNGYGNCCDPIYLLGPQNFYCDNPNQPFCGDNICNNGETSLTCPQDCFVSPICGDGNLDTGEQCDDGNMINSDGCSSLCVIENLTNQTNNLTEKNFWKGPRGCESGLCIGGINNFEQFCDVNWKCSGWTSCFNGVQKRTCLEESGCEYSYNKPNEVIPCAVSENSYVDEKNGLSPWEIGLGVMFVLLIILLIIVLFH